MSPSVSTRGSHFPDGTPLPARTQVVLNLSICDVAAFNATLDRFRLNDLLDAVNEGLLNPSNPEVKTMIMELFASVSAA